MTDDAPAPPLPVPDALTQFFWDGVARRELWIQRCRQLQALPPLPEDDLPLLPVA